MRYSRARAQRLRWRRPTAIVGLGVLIGVFLAAAMSPMAGYAVGLDVNVSRASIGPNAHHWLGTDHLGRDVFWRTCLASRSFALPGLLACLTAALIAVPGGAVAGYMGGIASTLIRYVFTVIASVPRFVLVLLACSIYGNDLSLLAVAAGITFVPTLGEAIHARIAELRTAGYITANRAYGLSSSRIVIVHLLWAVCSGLIARQLLNVFAYFLVLETTLSYIGGFGVREPDPSWGNMLVFDWGHDTGNPLAVIVPALAIWTTVAATRWVTELFDEATHG